MLHSCGDRLSEQSERAQLVGLLSSAANPDRALASFVETVDAWRISGDTILGAAIGHLVVLLARLGHYDGAARPYGAATRSVVLDIWVPELDASMVAAREAMGDDTFRAARDAGAALSYEAAGDLACELITSARAQLTSSQ